MVEILDSTYAKTDLKQVVNAGQMNAEERIFYLAFSKISRTCLMEL